jgi:hypothetical protein
MDLGANLQLEFLAEMFKFANIDIARRVQDGRVVFRASCTRCDQRPLHARVSRTVRRLRRGAVSVGKVRRADSA